MTESPNRTLAVRTWLPFVTWAVLFVLQLINPARIWMGLLLGLSVLIGMSYAWARALREGLNGRRLRRGAWVLAGDAMNETFVVENASRMTALWVEVLDQSDLPGYRADWVAYADPHNEQSYPRAAQCPRRGVFHLGPWRLRSGDPLGLFQVDVLYPAVETVVVYPRAMRLPDLRLFAGSLDGAARVRRRAQQLTDTVAGVRPYLPGDAQHLVHWRQSARQRQLMVKQFDLEPAGELWLALDLQARGHTGEGSASTLEYAVTLTASLAAQMIAENRRVGLAAAGVQLAPQNGQAQLWRILETLARMQPVEAYSLRRVLQDLRQVGQGGRGRTVVAVTPSTDPEWVAELVHLAGHGNTPAALLLQASTFLPAAAPAQAELAAAFAGVCSLLAEHGIAYHVFDRGFTFRPVTPITRTHTEWRTLSATGRVIPVQVEEAV